MQLQQIRLAAMCFGHTLALVEDHMVHKMQGKLLIGGIAGGKGVGPGGQRISSADGSNHLSGDPSAGGGKHRLRISVVPTHVADHLVAHREL